MPKLPLLLCPKAPFAAPFPISGHLAQACDLQYNFSPDFFSLPLQDRGNKRAVLIAEIFGKWGYPLDLAS